MCIYIVNDQAEGRINHAGFGALKCETNSPLYDHNAIGLDRRRRSLGYIYMNEKNSIRRKYTKILFRTVTKTSCNSVKVRSGIHAFIRIWGYISFFLEYYPTRYLRCRVIRYRFFDTYTIRPNRASEIRIYTVRRHWLRRNQKSIQCCVGILNTIFTLYVYFFFILISSELHIYIYI